MTSKMRIMKLAEESSFSFSAEDEVSTIGAKPINIAKPVALCNIPKHSASN